MKRPQPSPLSRAAQRWRAWFARMWSPAKAQMIAADYASVGAAHQAMLLDIAARGGLFSKAPPGVDPTTLAILEGRRQLAIETIELARLSPEELFGMMPQLPDSNTGDRS